MPGKSKTADTAATLSDDAIRQRAYYLWEADGRPEGSGEHYWSLAHHEAINGNDNAEPKRAKTAKAAKAAKAKDAKAKPAKASAPRPPAAARKAR